MARLFSLLLLGCLATMTTGCFNSDAPAYAKVSGNVSYQQKPVEGATVILIPNDATGRSATGTTDASGNFTLSTYFDPQTTLPGAVNGTYQVTIVKKEVQVYPENLTSEELMEYQKTMKPAKSLIPQKYSIPGKSGLTLEVDGSSVELLQYDLKD